MRTARFTLDPAFTVGEVNPRLFGSFVEHLGRCVYTGIFEPTHPTADDAGIRQDVLDLVRELGVTTIRYPGGNFVSGYKWEDSVGPAETRPRRLDLAWRSTESNRFGLSEYIAFLKKLGPQAEPMMAINLGTRGVAEALELQEYANHPAGTTLSEQRIAHGDKDPFGIRVWCLGNEMDGPWQTGHKTAEEYGRIAAETARAMRQIDAGVELVACGSSSQAMPTFAEWESTVLQETYDLVDYISLHAYYQPTDGDLDSFIASAVDMESFIENVVATADHVGARLKSKKKINLSFDEWNVWYTSDWEEQAKNADPADWPEAPRLLEDNYSVMDAVVFGSLLIALLRHADRVTVACLAQLVNVIAPIMTEDGGPAWRQTIYYPLYFASKYGRGYALRLVTDGPTYDSDEANDVPYLDVSAVHDVAANMVTLFAVNRHLDSSLDLDTRLEGFAGARVVEQHEMVHEDLGAVNTASRPNAVVPTSTSDAKVEDGRLRATLKPLSYTVIRLSV